MAATKKRPITCKLCDEGLHFMCLNGACRCVKCHSTEISMERLNAITRQHMGERFTTEFFKETPLFDAIHRGKVKG